MKLLPRLQKSFLTTTRDPMRFFILVLLVISLPVFIWAVATQRLELRKRATTAEPPQVCWNRVLTFNNQFQWPSGCRGAITSGGCTAVLVPLTPQEVEQYNAWVNQGKPAVPAGCDSSTGVRPTVPSSCPTPPPCRLPLVHGDPGPNSPSRCPMYYCPQPTPESSCSGPNGSTCTITECPSCPPGMYCTQMCRVARGICQNGSCVPGAPTVKPTCIPPPSCMFPPPGQPVCLMAIPQGGWFCPNTTPSVCPTPPACAFGRLIYGDPQRGGCPAYKCLPTPTPPQGCVYKQVQCIRAPCDPILVCPTERPTKTPTPTPTPATQTVKFKVKLAGVTDGKAEGALINVKFYKRDGTVVRIPQSLSLVHLGAGVYEATATLTNPFPAGTGFTVWIKGEKHVARRFCRQVGQTGACAEDEAMTVPNPVPLSYGFDFTGLPLEPGDLPVQDGRVDAGDAAKVKDLLGKPCSALTVDEKKTGDLDYNGCINVLDAYLLRKTLETRYDEN